MEKRWLVRIWLFDNIGRLCVTKAETDSCKWVEEREVSAETDCEAIARAFAKCQQPTHAVNVEVALLDREVEE